MVARRRDIGERRPPVGGRIVDLVRWSVAAAPAEWIGIVRTCRGITVRTARWLTVLDVQVPLSGRYESAGEVSAPERLVRTFGDPRTVQLRLRLPGRQIATSLSLWAEE